MGHGVSKDLKTGMPVNPRVDYADELSKKEKKPKLIDAPVLVELEHGTIRYRYVQKEQDPKDKKKRVEKPYEGSDLEMKKKDGYFYHTRINNSNKEQDEDREGKWRFRYVCQGPSTAKQKKVYYVFGQKLEAVDRGIMQAKPLPHKPTHFWSPMQRLPNHAYFNLHFLPQNEELELDGDQEDMDSDLTEESITREIELKVADQDSIGKLKSRLSLRLLKPQEHIHIYQNDILLQNDDVLGNLKSETDQQWMRFMIQLSPM